MRSSAQVKGLSSKMTVRELNFGRHIKKLVDPWIDVSLFINV